MSGKEQLHQLVESLPADRLESARKALTDLCEESSGSGQLSAERAIEQILEDLATRIPREEWDRLPPDLTDDLDHYLYGTPNLYGTPQR